MEEKRESNHVDQAQRESRKGKGGTDKEVNYTEGMLDTMREKAAGKERIYGTERRRVASW